MRTFRVALVQLAADEDVEANVGRALALIDRAAASHPDLVALPENALYRGRGEGFVAAATDLPGPLVEPFAERARALGAWLLLGSVPERSADAARPYITSVLFDPEGRIAATYRKRHLFDVTVEGLPPQRESARATAGDETVVACLPGAASGQDVQLGLSICFDVRFPELYRDLASRGAEVLSVPSDFRERTGRDHWEVLLRARAIENGAFVIAPAQFGRVGTVETHGRSLVVDPWGIVVAQAPDGAGVVMTDLDLDRVAEVRRQLPSLPR